MKDSRNVAIVGSVMLIAPAVIADIGDVQAVVDSEEWETLKTIWRMMDRLEPEQQVYSSTYPLAMEKGDSLIAQINWLFAETDSRSPELNSALYLIRRITSTRIIRLSRINTAMMTRMMPPWTDTLQDEILFNFENRITTLTSLVEDGEISTSEFVAARDTLLLRAETWAVLEILKDSGTYRSYYGYPLAAGEILDADVILEQLDLSYRAALDTLAKEKPSEYIENYKMAVQQHEEFMERYDEFEEARPILRILLTQLMEPGI